MYRTLGVLLPCNVVMGKDSDAPDTVLIDAMDPRLGIEVT